jgi:hypothetical protein
MKVFLSWSGHRSRLVAAALKELLPAMLQPITCWMSENDLPKGKPWFDQLAKEMGSITFAIVCVTRENANSRWMNWEAGFMSSTSALGDRRVAPFAVGMSASLDGPLAIYQATTTSHDDVVRLVRDINSALPAEKQIAIETLETTFEMVWPRLEQKLKAAIDASVAEPAVPAPAESALLTEAVGLLRQQQRELADVKNEVNALRNSVTAPMNLTDFTQLAGTGVVLPPRSSFGTPGPTWAFPANPAAASTPQWYGSVQPQGLMSPNPIVTLDTGGARFVSPTTGVTPAAGLMGGAAGPAPPGTKPKPKPGPK